MGRASDFDFWHHRLTTSNLYPPTSDLIPYPLSLIPYPLSLSPVPAPRYSSRDDDPEQ